MKKLIMLFIVAATMFSCSDDDDTKEENVLIGKWKLTQITSFDATVYTPEESENVYYTFNSNKTVAIESNVNLPENDGFYQHTSPKTIPYSFYTDNEFLMQKVVVLGDSENSLGKYGFKKWNDSLSFYEYDGRSLLFVKAN